MIDIQAGLASPIATAAILAARPTFTPTPAYAPTGQPIPVWIYSDSAPESDDCRSIFVEMVPASASPDIAGMAYECILDPGFRVSLLRGEHGYYHLESVELLLLLTTDPLTGWDAEGRLRSCDSISSHIHPASRPAAAAGFVGVCRYAPPYRGEVARDGQLVWARIRSSLAPVTLSPDLPCEYTIRYLDSAGEATDLRNMTCLLR